jgi:hypothetical protein
VCSEAPDDQRRRTFWKLTEVLATRNDPLDGRFSATDIRIANQ